MNASMKKGRARQPGQIKQSPTAKKGSVDVSINHANQERIEVMVMFRIISRRSWDNLQSWHRACPGSTVEHVRYGIYVLVVPPGGALEAAA